MPLYKDKKTGAGIITSDTSRKDEIKDQLRNAGIITWSDKWNVDVGPNRDVIIITWDDGRPYMRLYKC